MGHNLNMKRLLLAILFLGLAHPVKANIDREMSRQYIQDMNRLTNDLSEAANNEDMERICPLILEYQITLDAGWSYFRDAGMSYETLVKQRNLWNNLYEQGCKK